MVPSRTSPWPGVFHSMPPMRQKGQTVGTTGGDSSPPPRPLLCPAWGSSWIGPGGRSHLRPSLGNPPPVMPRCTPPEGSKSDMYVDLPGVGDGVSLSGSPLLSGASPEYWVARDLVAGSSLHSGQWTRRHDHYWWVLPSYCAPHGAVHELDLEGGPTWGPPWAILHRSCHVARLLREVNLICM